MKTGLIPAVLSFLSFVIFATHAESEGYVRIYDDLGEPVTAKKLWHLNIEHDLGKHLSPQGSVLLSSNPQWSNTTIRWTAFKSPRVGHVVAAIEAGTTDDIKTTVSVTFLLLMVS